MLTATLYLVWFLFYFSLISLAAGLIRPVYVLWFLDRMNRLKVIKLYGAAAFGLTVIILVLEYYIG